jgi:hypothetical protein
MNGNYTIREVFAENRPLLLVFEWVVGNSQWNKSKF